MNLSDIAGIWSFQDVFKNRKEFILIGEEGYWFQFITTSEDAPDSRRALMLYTILDLKEDGELSVILMGLGSVYKSRLTFEGENLILTRDEYRIEMNRENDAPPE